MRNIYILAGICAAFTGCGFTYRREAPGNDKPFSHMAYIMAGGDQKEEGTMATTAWLLDNTWIVPVLMIAFGVGAYLFREKLMEEQRDWDRISELERKQREAERDNARIRRETRL